MNITEHKKFGRMSISDRYITSEVRLYMNSIDAEFTKQCANREAQQQEKLNNESTGKTSPARGVSLGKH